MRTYRVLESWRAGDRPGFEHQAESAHDAALTHARWRPPVVSEGHSSHESYVVSETLDDGRTMKTLVRVRFEHRLHVEVAV